MNTVGPINGWEFLDYLSDYQLFKKDPSSWNIISRPIIIILHRYCHHNRRINFR
jgi:hypothetical protein